MISSGDIILRLLLSVFLSGFIGYEREKHNKKMAGFRTHILVAVGSTLIMLLSLYIYELYERNPAIDPSRIAASVVTGIGFLGAGTIIRDKSGIKGLTTAASLWAVSGIGLAIGCGFYLGSFVTTIIVFVTLYWLRKVPLEEK